MSNSKYVGNRVLSKGNSCNTEFTNFYNNTNKIQNLNNMNLLHYVKNNNQLYETEPFNNDILSKKSFNQIKLIKDNKRYDLYKITDSCNKNDKKSNLYSKDITKYIHVFVNEKLISSRKNYNCFNLKEIIKSNLHILKEKITNEKEVQSISEEKNFITNQHLINNCSLLNMRSNKANNNKENFERLSNGKDNNLNFLDNDIINSNQIFYQNKNKNKHDNKLIIRNNTLKLRKNFSSILKNKQDLYEYLDRKICPLISHNFEKEKKRVNTLVGDSNDLKRSSIIDKTQNSSIDKNNVITKNIINSNLLETDIKNIEEMNKSLPRKYQTANNLKNEDNNVDINKDSSIQKIFEQRILKSKRNFFNLRYNNNYDLFHLTSERKIRDEDNMNSNVSYKKREIFTPDINLMRRSINSTHDYSVKNTFPARNILKIKHGTDVNKKTRTENNKDSVFYYKNKKKLKILQKINSNLILLHNKNLNLISDSYKIPINDYSYVELGNEAISSNMNDKRFNDIINEENQIKNESNEENQIKNELNKEKQIKNELSEENLIKNDLFEENLIKNELNEENDLENNKVIASINFYSNNNEKKKINNIFSEIPYEHSEINKKNLKEDILSLKDKDFKNASEKESFEKYFNLSRFSYELIEDNYNKEINKYENQSKKVIDIKCKKEKDKLFSSKLINKSKGKFVDNIVNNKKNTINNLSKSNKNGLKNFNYYNTTACNFFSKNKIFSYNTDESSKDKSKLSLKKKDIFSNTLNVKKINFNYKNELIEKEKSPQIKSIKKTTKSTVLSKPRNFFKNKILSVNH